MFNKFLSNNLAYIFSILIIFIFILYSYFFASVVRTVEEDQLIKKGFDAKAYVENIWKSKIIPTISNEAEEVRERRHGSNIHCGGFRATRKDGFTPRPVARAPQYRLRD